MIKEERFPRHIESLISNRDEIHRLLDIHQQVGGSGRGRRSLEILNRSAIVMLVACWEAYVEDLADIAFDYLLRKADSHEKIPEKVRSIASKHLKEDSRGIRIWDLAGDGWKIVLSSHKEMIKKNHIGKLNTPRPAQVDDLFEKMIGLKGVSKEWKWKGASNNNVIERLDKLVTLRGSIAHRVTEGDAVRKVDVEQTLDFIGFISAKLSNQVTHYLGDTTGEMPWKAITYGKIE